MKKHTWIVCVLVLLLTCTACGGRDSIIGRWETEANASALGLNMTNNFITTITRISFLEEGVGTWEIEIVESREILRREFSFTQEGDTLRITYPDGTAQEFQVDFEKGILLLTGRENLSLKRVTE